MLKARLNAGQVVRVSPDSLYFAGQVVTVLAVYRDDDTPFRVRVRTTDGRTASLPRELIEAGIPCEIK